jgi:hypothetical protein
MHHLHIWELYRYGLFPMISTILARLFENNDMTKLTNYEVRGCVTDTFHKIWCKIKSVRAPKILLGHLSR